MMYLETCCLDHHILKPRGTVRQGRKSCGGCPTPSGSGKWSTYRVFYQALANRLPFITSYHTGWYKRYSSKYAGRQNATRYKMTEKKAIFMRSAFRLIKTNHPLA